MDRDGSQHAFGLPRSIRADSICNPGDLLITEVIRKDTQLLDRTAWNPLHGGTLMNVHQMHECIFASRVDAIGNDRRCRSLTERDGFQERLSFLLPNQHHVIEHIRQVDSPQRIRCRLARNQEVLVVERIRMQKLGPAVFGEFVLNEWLDLLATAGNPLYYTVRFKFAFRWIEHDQLADATDMVPRHNSNKL